MIAYVDENGMITSTPPAENTPKEEIKLEEIVISTPKKTRKNRSSAEDVSNFSMNRKASASSRTYPESKNTFFHINNVLTDITKGNIVTSTLNVALKA